MVGLTQVKEKRIISVTMESDEKNEGLTIRNLFPMRMDT